LRECHAIEELGPTRDEAPDIGSALRGPPIDPLIRVLPSRQATDQRIAGRRVDVRIVPSEALRGRTFTTG